MGGSRTDDKKESHEIKDKMHENKNSVSQTHIIIQNKKWYELFNLKDSNVFAQAYSPSSSELSLLIGFF